MKNAVFKGICSLAVSGVIAGFAFTSSANAATIGTFAPGSYLQSGTVTNSHSSAMIGFIIDFVADAGIPSPGSPVWDTNNGAFVGTPPGVFESLAPNETDAFFKVSFLGLNIANGGTFNYAGLDYDGYTGVDGTEGGVPTLLDGSEFATLLFADGSSVSANFPAGNAFRVPDVLFDSENLVDTPVNTVPVPAALPLLASGLGFVGLMGWRRNRRTKAAC